MAIRWESYRNRKRLDPTKWASYLKITTYKDLCDRLLKMGITPPERHHPDFVEILSDSSEDAVQKKPSSGRVPGKESTIDDSSLSDKGRSPKPTSGRVSDIIEPAPLKETGDIKSASSKPKQKRRRRKSTRKTSPSSKKPPSKK